LGAAARKSSHCQVGLSATFSHFGSAVGSVSSDGSFPLACWISAHVPLRTLTSVAVGPMRANGSPSRPSTTTGWPVSFLRKTAGTVRPDTTWTVRPSVGVVDDFWTVP
jgi:hypothetical protein